VFAVLAESAFPDYNRFAAVPGTLSVATLDTQYSTEGTVTQVPAAGIVLAAVDTLPVVVGGTTAQEPAVVDTSAESMEDTASFLE
jgi:hypothetical protein